MQECYFQIRLLRLRIAGTLPFGSLSLAWRHACEDAQLRFVEGMNK